MRILAIETSCDETALCLLEATETPSGVTFHVIRNITHTQLEHVAYGGVFPVIAKREHQKWLPIILEKIMGPHPLPPLLEGEGHAPVDYICVTNGPGLEPALWCGITFAKELGEQYNVPVVPVNHMEGHILSVLAPGTSPLSPALEGEGNRTFEFNNNFQFPALALLISGGHTELVLVKAISDYEIIGRTRDDAVGEAYDKVARMLGLPYPGGPEISKLANQFSGESKIEFPRPMLHTKDYDFSFSGLKTAVLYYIQSLTSDSKSSPGSLREPPSPLRGGGPNLTEDEKIQIAHEFQNAVTDVLIKKTTRTIEDFGIETLIIGGGVSANTFITESFKKTLEKDFPHVSLHIPARELTGDNALMIALAGYFKIQKNPDVDYGDIRAAGNLTL